ncbi:MAG: PepSY domain-containing protein [Methylobacter sp.]|nr:PepSY domain-containing protein [Methylobacter sp.]
MKNLIKVVALVFWFSTICFAESNILLVRVSLDQATQQIIRDNNKRVLGAHTEIIDGKEVHVIKVLTSDGRIQHYKIDAETGAIIS